jgi:hypothetical protein
VVIISLEGASINWPSAIQSKVKSFQIKCTVSDWRGKKCKEISAVDSPSFLISDNPSFDNYEMKIPFNAAWTEAVFIKIKFFAVHLLGRERCGFAIIPFNDFFRNGGAKTRQTYSLQTIATTMSKRAMLPELMQLVTGHITVTLSLNLNPDNNHTDEEGVKLGMRFKLAANVAMDTYWAAQSFLLNDVSKKRTGESCFVSPAPDGVEIALVSPLERKDDNTVADTESIFGDEEGDVDEEDGSQPSRSQPDLGTISDRSVNNISEKRNDVLNNTEVAPTSKRTDVGFCFPFLGCMSHKTVLDSVEGNPPVLPLISSLGSKIRRSTSIFDTPASPRQVAYLKRMDTVLTTCQERAGMDVERFTISWSNVSSVDLVTDGVLSLVVQIHRFLGEDKRTGKEVYKNALIEILITDCPARILQDLIMDRINMAVIRSELRSIEDPINLLLQLDQKACLLEEEAGLVPDPRESIVHAKENAIETWTNDSATLIGKAWRLRMYIAVLIQLTSSKQTARSGRDGHEGEYFDRSVSRNVFDWAQVAERLVSEDLALAREVKGETIVQKISEQVNLLLGRAHMHIAEAALRGWDQEGPFECFVQTVLNEFLIELTALISTIFEGSQVIRTVKVSTNL